MKQESWWPHEGEEPDPRWSLANERTFLAYSRTALALVVSGLAIAGSQTIADVPNWFAALGVPLIALGAVVAITSRTRLVRAQRAMRTGEPLPAPNIASLLSIGIACVAFASVVVAMVQLL